MKIQGLNSSNIFSIKDIDNIIEKLNIGDKLRVQVIAVSDNQIMLRLPNGTNIAATPLVALNVTLGDFLDLSVKNKTDSQITFETGKNIYEESKTNEVLNTLLSIKMPLDERNVEIGRALLNQHMALNKENFNKIINIISNFEDIDIQKAAFITANNIDSLENGIEVLDKAEENLLDLSKAINNLEKVLYSQTENTINEIVQNYEEKAISQAAKNQSKELLNLVKLFDGSEEQIKNIVNSILDGIFNGILENHSSFDGILKTDITDKSLKQLINNQQLTNNENNSILEFIDKHPLIKKSILEILNNKTELKKMISDFSKNSSVIFKPHAEGENVIDKVKNFLHIKNIIKDGRINSEINVNKYYEDLLLKLDAVQSQIYDSNLVSNKDAVLQSLSEIRKNIDFMNNINNLFYYFQLPMNINHKDSTVDLYIVKNTKAHKKINPNNATLFISLRTQNLGIVETLIHVENKKVDFNFRLDNDNIISYFSKRQYLLENLINEKGYKLNKVNFSINIKQTNVASFEHIIHDDKTVIRDVFDARV